MDVKLAWKDAHVAMAAHGFRIVLLQNLIQQPRPKESCLTSCGMPSGHAVAGPERHGKTWKDHDHDENGKVDDGGDADEKEEKGR